MNLIDIFDKHPLSQEVGVAVQAVSSAGVLCKAVQGEHVLAAMSKEDRSPVTIADFGSQAIICRDLMLAFPNDPVIGEEDAKELREADTELATGSMLNTVVTRVQEVVSNADASSVCQWIDRGNAKNYSPRFWTLDPIDGTKGFLRGMQYAISLALIVDGVIQVAVVGCPNMGAHLTGDTGMGSVYIAVKGSGTWQLPMFGAEELCRVQVSSEQNPANIRFCESWESAHSSHSDSALIAEALSIAAKPVRIDSQAKYAVVGRGEAEAYLRMPRDKNYREKIWDHAGGALVVTEAGGMVTDLYGRELDFTNGYQLENSHGVLATNGHLHQNILDVVKKLGL